MCHYMPTYQNEIEINPSSFSTLTHHQSWKSVDHFIMTCLHHRPLGTVLKRSFLASVGSVFRWRISVPVTLFGAYIYSMYIYIDAMMEENVKTPRSMATSCHFCFGVRNRTEVSIMEYRIHHWHDANAMTMQSRM